MEQNRKKKNKENNCLKSYKNHEVKQQAKDKVII